MCFVVFENVKRERDIRVESEGMERLECVSEVFWKNEIISECCLFSGCGRVRWRLHESMPLPPIRNFGYDNFGSVLFFFHFIFLFFFLLPLPSTCLTSSFRVFFICKQILLHCYFWVLF